MQHRKDTDITYQEKLDLMGKLVETNTVNPAKNDPFCLVLTFTGGVTVVFLHAVSNRKYLYTIEK